MSIEVPFFDKRKCLMRPYIRGRVFELTPELSNPASQEARQQSLRGDCNGKGSG